MKKNPKDIAKDFLHLVGTGKVEEGYDKYVSKEFIHHNQYFKGDRQSLLEAMKQAHNDEPNELVDVKNVFQDGQTVITHSLIVKKSMKITVVHLFKFENGKIVELWDLGQIIDEASPNENGLF
ncbi:nuclear transport factor 2 family protein [Portibacter marinus]|uniref:nuclear transport factor 2 family protein n=1 Tax=Portibacter marinus TaxID=2898660 RepID=UPI001F48BFAD|nr:nuclear transport factor 2 family protein [Portibacter marinus]